MLIGDSADGQQTCISTRVSCANVGRRLWGGSDKKEAVVGGRVTSLHMVIGDSADGEKTCISTRVSRANVGGQLWGGSDKIKLG